MVNILELANITAGYGRTVILEDVSVSLQQGAALALLGRNGVGKSTLMRTIAGHTTLHHGQIRLEGQDIANAHPGLGRELGRAGRVADRDHPVLGRPRPRTSASPRSGRRGRPCVTIWPLPVDDGAYDVPDRARARRGS